MYLVHTQAGQITEITTSEKGDSKITIVSAMGKNITSCSNRFKLLVKQGDIVKAEQPLNIDPNAGGFGQEESKLYYKTHYELSVT